MADRRAGPLAVIIALFAFSACGKGEERDARPKRPAATETTVTASVTPSATTLAVPPPDPTRPRYLRVNGQGELVDATRFPSVPESIVEKEVRNATDRRDAAKLLHRFGVNPSIDRGGEVAYVQASLVDGLGRERLLVVTLVGDADADGYRDETVHIVFLATTDDERLIGLGSDSISARTHVSAPIKLEAVPLHSMYVDDLVARWSSCSLAKTKGCHGIRAWTMDRGYPERILDVVGDAPAVIGGVLSPPHDVTSGLVVLKFDVDKYAYRPY